ncbi:MAG: Hsp20/alpha crystallin family protein [Ignavibacteria bacterium]|nr:Hsp20/alpha crystallin family protein [Ignavibacteria bacterium]
MTRNNEVSVVQREPDTPASLRQDLSARAVIPYADIYETADSYVLMLDLPGATKDGIHVSIEKDALIVKADVPAYHADNTTLLRNEIRGASYYRVFNIGEGVDTANVDGQFAEGVLTLKLFKTERLRPKEITIT